ncbi:MAG: hypothetical protein HYS86_03420, partial [Candidatus Chisholmbacteria bacterium]|nr:hypothetical protein [Candidatus Chisholmbacteria bacterium]
ERGGLPSLIGLAFEVKTSLLLSGVVASVFWGLAAGEAQVIIDRSLDISRLVVGGA